MKKILSFSIFSLMMIASCSEDNSSSGKDDIIGTLSSGTWRVTSFIEDDSDQTSHFSGYQFTFRENDVLTATNGTTTVTGSWNITSNSNDDSPDDIDFNIYFSGPGKFEELSEDWEILTRTSVKIELRHVSGGDGSVDYLTFEKN